MMIAHRCSCICVFVHGCIFICALKTDKWTTNHLRLRRQLLLNIKASCTGPCPPEDVGPCTAKSKYSFISFPPVKTRPIPSQSNKNTNSISSFILKWSNVDQMLWPLFAIQAQSNFWSKNIVYPVLSVISHDHTWIHMAILQPFVVVLKGQYSSIKIHILQCQSY